MPRGGSLALLLYVLLPPVIFFNIAASEIDLDHGVGLVLGIVASSLGALLAWWVASRVLKLAALPGRRRRLLRAQRQHRLPRLPADRGPARPRRALHRGPLRRRSSPGPACCSAPSPSAPPSAPRRAKAPRQRVGAFFTRNPPLYAAIAGLLAPEALAPDVLVDLSQALIVAILPIGFFAVGATLAENAEHGELPMPPPLTRPVALAIATRLAVVPALLMLLAAPADRPPGRLPPALGDALRPQLPGHRPRLRPRHGDHRRGGHLVDRDRRRRLAALALLL